MSTARARKIKSAPRYAMVVDARRCVGCSACVLACKAENRLSQEGLRGWVTVETRGVFPHLSQRIYSQRCNHCDDPACVDNCPTGASYRRRDGLVLVEHDACTGCKACIAACPYEARYVHPDGYADKCTFCAHRLDKGRGPACAEVCPTGAITFGDLSDPDSAVSRLLRARRYETLQPERGLGPNVYYLV